MVNAVMRCMPFRALTAVISSCDSSTCIGFYSASMSMLSC